jgi:N-acyl homoserine lactone hydrolase
VGSLSIVPLDGGRLTGVERSTQQYLTGFGEKICVHLTMWLILGLDEPILVDVAAGPPEIVSRYQSRDLDQPRHPEQLLSDVGLTFRDIRTVVLTHLHWDHCLGLLAGTLGHATAYVQRRELQYAGAPFEPHRGLYNRTVLAGFGSKELPDLRVLDGDHQLAPGVRIVHTPGHTPGTSAVIVDTDRGRCAIASDNVPLASSWRGGTADGWTPNGIHVDLAECYSSLARLAGEADYVLPSHCESVHSAPGAGLLPTAGAA